MKPARSQSVATIRTRLDRLAVFFVRVAMKKTTSKANRESRQWVEDGNPMRLSTRTSVREFRCDWWDRRANLAQNDIWVRDLAHLNHRAILNQRPTVVAPIKCFAN